MSRKRIELTPSVHSKIVQAIQSGGYPHVAAEAMSVPNDVFDHWLQRGGHARAREPYRSFADDVRFGFAQARLITEITIHKDEPKIWLIHGPGRETSDLPGWSVSVKPTERAVAERNALRDPEVTQMLQLLLQTLVPFPEARVVVSQKFMQLGVNETRRDPSTRRMQ